MNRRAYTLGVVMIFAVNVAAIALRSYAEAAFLASYGAGLIPVLLVSQAIAFALGTVIYDAATGRAPSATVDVLVSPLGVPCTEPPWGTLLALEIETGRVVWQVPFGSTRDLAPFPFWLDWGLPSMGGPILTASGVVFIGAAMDDYLRAFDVETGALLWKARLPAGGQATPMTYRLRPGSRGSGIGDRSAATCAWSLMVSHPRGAGNVGDGGRPHGGERRLSLRRGGRGRNGENYPFPENAAWVFSANTAIADWLRPTRRGRRGRRRRPASRPRAWRGSRRRGGRRCAG